MSSLREAGAHSWVRLCGTSCKRRTQSSAQQRTRRGYCGNKRGVPCSCSAMQWFQHRRARPSRACFNNLREDPSGGRGWRRAWKGQGPHDGRRVASFCKDATWDGHEDNRGSQQERGPLLAQDVGWCSVSPMQHQDLRDSRSWREGKEEKGWEPLGVYREWRVRRPDGRSATSGPRWRFAVALTAGLSRKDRW